MTEPGAAPVPSDAIPAVLATGRGDVELGVFSLSARSPEGRDAEYLEWHLLDHLPEQYRMPCLRWGQRWRSTDACRAARRVSTEGYDAVDHVVNYLFAPPIETAVADFFALGAALRLDGRLPYSLPAVELAAYRVGAKRAAERALVGADVLPFRPNRGVYLLIEAAAAGADVESDLADLLDVDGVAGFWQHAGTEGLHPYFAPITDHTLTVLYLDDEPARVAGRVGEILDRRWQRVPSITPLLAAPFDLVVPWRWETSEA